MNLKGFKIYLCAIVFGIIQIILDVENSKYAPKYQLTLRAMMMNPKSSVKRLHIHKKRTDE